MASFLVKLVTLAVNGTFPRRNCAKGDRNRQRRRGGFVRRLRTEQLEDRRVLSGLVPQGPIQFDAVGTAQPVTVLVGEHSAQIDLSWVGQQSAASVSSVESVETVAQDAGQQLTWTIGDGVAEGEGPVKAGGATSGQQSNKFWPDVNCSESVTPLDVLLIVDYLNYEGPGPQNLFTHPGVWLDVDFSGNVTPLDALRVVDYVNINGSGPWTFDQQAEGNVLVPMQEGVVAMVGDNVKIIKGEFFPTGGDAFFTALSLKASGPEGSFVGLEVYADLDGDLQPESLVGTPMEDSDPLVWAFPIWVDTQEGQTVPFEIRATVAQDAQPGTTAFCVDGAEAMEWGGERLEVNVLGQNYSTVTVQAQGSVFTAELGRNNPYGDTIAKGATVHSLSVRLTDVGNQDGQLETVIVSHGGYGEISDIAAVWLEVNDVRVSNPRTFDTVDQIATLRLLEPIVLQTGGAMDFDVVVSYATSAVTSGEHQYSIELPSDLGGDFDYVVGVFPLNGDTFQVAAVAAGTVTVTNQAVTPASVSVGDRAIVGQFELRADSVEDQVFYSVQVKVDGPSGALANMALRRLDGVTVTGYSQELSGGYFQIYFDPPMALLEGDRITLQIVADVFRGEGSTISVGVEESGDVKAVGSLFGNAVNGELNGSPVILVGTPTVITIGEPELWVGINGPSSTTVNPGDNDVILANVTFDASEEINVRSMPVALDCQDSLGNAISIFTILVEDVELRNVSTGRVIDAVLEGSGLTQVLTFRDFVVSEGTSTWQLRLDVEGGGTGERLRASILDGVAIDQQLWSIQTSQMDSGEPVNCFPGGTIAGNWMEDQLPKLVVQEKSGPSSGRAVENERQITVGILEARAQYADLFLTELVYVTVGGAYQNVYNGSLWVDSDGNGAVDTILESGVYGVSGKFMFSNLLGGGYVVPKDTTIKFEVREDVAASLSADPHFQASLLSASAEKLSDGSDLASDNVIVFQTPQTPWTFTDQGTLSMESEPHRPKDMVLAGDWMEFINVRFTAVDEPIAILSVPFNRGGYSAYKDLGVYLNDVELEGVTVSGGRIQFPFGGFVVPEGERVNLTVKALLNEGQTNTWYEASMDRSQVSAVGWISSNRIPGGTGLITGPMFQVTTVAPSNIWNAGPATAAMPNGVAEFGRFEIVVSGATGYAAGSDQVTFDVTGVNVGLGSDFWLVNMADAQTEVHVTGVPTASGYSVTFTGLADSSLLTEIPGGENGTFMLKGVVTNPNTAAGSGGTSTLQAALKLTDGFYKWYDNADSSVVYDWVDLPVTRVNLTTNIG